MWNWLEFNLTEKTLSCGLNGADFFYHFHIFAKKKGLLIHDYCKIWTASKITWDKTSFHVLFLTFMMAQTLPKMKSLGHVVWTQVETILHRTIIGYLLNLTFIVLSLSRTKWPWSINFQSFYYGVFLGLLVLGLRHIVFEYALYD